MTHLSTKPVFRKLLIALTCLGASGCSDKQPAKDNVDELHQHWWVVGGYDHGSNTGDSLSFLKPEVRRLLGVATEDTDGRKYKHAGVDTIEHSYFHFDNCRFEESAELLNRHFDSIVNTLDGSTGSYDPGDTKWRIALRDMGFIFHAVQDFYAHSNWVESGESDLIDKGRGHWPALSAGKPVGKQMVIVQDKDLAGPGTGLPPNVFAKLDRNEHVLNLFDATGQPLRDQRGVVVTGLITGTHHNKDNLGPNGFSQHACLQDEQLSMKHGAAANCEDEDVQVVCEERGLVCLEPEPLEHVKDLIDNAESGPKLLAEAVRKAAYYAPREYNWMNVCGDIWRSTYVAKDHPPELIPLPPAFPPEADKKKRIDWRNTANELARRQTVQEFCRLRSLMSARYGSDGLTRIDSAWVSDRQAMLTACAEPPYSNKTSQRELVGVEGSRLSVADIDQDGYADLVVREASDLPAEFGPFGRQRVHVLRNVAGKRFEDITKKSSLVAGRLRDGGKNTVPSRGSQTVVFGDVDNDGDLDAFSGSPAHKIAGEPGILRPEILLNQGDGVFATIDYYAFGAIKDLNPGGATFVDYDRDGLLDLFVPARKRRASGANGWLFKGTGKKKQLFEEVGTFTGIGEYAQSSVACDVNNDGWQELLVGTIKRGSNGLWAGTSSGVFLPRHEDSNYAFDRGGTSQNWTDNLYARAYCSYARAGEVPVHYGRSEECQSLPSGCPPSCQSFPCDAVRPAQPGEDAECQSVPPFTGPAVLRFTLAQDWDHSRSRAKGRLGGNTFSTICADFDRDGRLDLFNAEQRSSSEGQSADPAQVLRNTSTDGDHPEFLRLARAATGLEIDHGGTPWVEGIQTAASLDFDNDGQVDLFLGGADARDNWGRLYRNDTATSGAQVHFTAQFLHGLKYAQGIAIADFDRDGDLDFVTGGSAYRCPAGESCPEQVQYFQNDLANKRGWLQIYLVGKGTGKGSANKAAIGARVSVTLPNGSCTTSVKSGCLVQEVDGGHGHFGAQHDQTLHFGLGDVTQNVVVNVRWPRDPSGEGQVQDRTFNLKPGMRYEIHEGLDRAIEVPPPAP